MVIVGILKLNLIMGLKVIYMSYANRLTKSLYSLIEATTPLGKYAQSVSTSASLSKQFDTIMPRNQRRLKQGDGSWAYTFNFIKTFELASDDWDELALQSDEFISDFLKNDLGVSNFTFSNRGTDRYSGNRVFYTQDGFQVTIFVEYKYLENAVGIVMYSFCIENKRPDLR